MAARFQLGNIGCQGFGVGGVQFKQLELVAVAFLYDAVDDERGAGVDLVATGLVEAGH